MMPVEQPPAMDLREEALPSGTWVLEASAGTGKTYTIAGLVARYVAEGHVRIDQILAVTFGRAATSELRNRVRERLVLVRDALQDSAERPLTDPASSDDPVIVHLCAGPADEVRARRDRLSTALADFDAATVATVHEFCQQVLVGIGIAADYDAGTELVESVDVVRDQAIEDLYLRWINSTASNPEAFSAQTARLVGRAVIADRAAVLLPRLGSLDDADPASIRVRFARRLRDEVDRRLRGARVLGFDDLLVRVQAALADPVSGHIAADRLRDRYRVVLVDEFQDTDPVQWDVLRRAFHGHRTMVLIGDPKQAIYAFRGADVQAYLAAVRSADVHATLTRNWRSDPEFVHDLQRMFREAALGDQRIVVRDVAVGHNEPLLGAEKPGPAISVRLLDRTGLPQTQSGLVKVPAAREQIARDVAVQIRQILARGWTVTPRGGGIERPLQAADIAVLVRKGTQATLVRDTLRDNGIPVVLTGTESVYATEAARDWVDLLEGLEQPSRNGRVRVAALSNLVGWTATELDTLGQDGVDRLRSRCRYWATVLTERGFAAMFAAVSIDQRLAERLLRLRDGERLLTDLRHIAESLHDITTRDRLGLSAVLDILRQRIHDALGDPDQERSRRLDTDAAAVQVTTVHTSKGLEFPIVLLPFAWDTFGKRADDRLPRGHDDQARRTLHVGGNRAADYQAACAAEDVDEAGEELRLLYVAATRTVSRLITWWAPTFNTARSPLHRLLFTEYPAADIPSSVKVPPDVTALKILGAVLPSAELFTAPVPDAPAPPSSGDAAAAPLSAATLGRELTQLWRRTSYSGLTRALHEHTGDVRSEPELSITDDEAEEGTGDDADGRPDPLGSAAPPVRPAGTRSAIPSEADPSGLREIGSPMADLPAGAEFGTLVHSVLESADLGATDLAAALTDAARRELRWRRHDVDPEVLAQALVPPLRTPWGPISDGACLADFPADQRLAELDFELPLAGGDRPRSSWSVIGDLAPLIEALPADDPVRPYADMLRSPGFAEETLYGYLTGSIDLVVRVGSPSPRYLVVDHKTNRLGPPDVALTAWHYRRSALDEAVLHAHYPLQAMLYSVALHRFLRWRLKEYDPDLHLGGVAYLFLRGMCGDQVASDEHGDVPGVWSWRPPATLVTALSDIMAGVRS